MVSSPEKSPNVRFSWWLRGALRAADAVAPEWTLRRALDRFLATTRRKPSPAAEAFRASGEPLRVRLDGGDLVARSWGSGPVVLLLHGWNGGLTDFRHLVPAIVDRGLRAVAVEARGHGESDGDDASALHLGWALAAVAAEVGPVQGVVAHSLGGAASAWAVAGGAVPARRLALIAPAADPERYIRAVAENVGAAFADRMVRAVHERLGAHPEVLALRRNVAATQVPTLVVHDADDAETPIGPVADAIEGLRHATLLRTERLGHRRILADARVARAIAAHLTGTTVRACPHGRLEGACEACALERELYEPGTRFAA